MASNANASELMTALSTEQAKQSQKDSWLTGAAIFQSMMGYVYSVLQAFVFAITPIILAALLLPGFGRAILKNFGQILLWLVLWDPLLAIISFIMAGYAQHDIAPAVTAGGLTIANISIVSQKTATLTTAAGFLATMVPMIAWGLVKGSIAFTEFISHGVGSSFANSAGQMLATGNAALDNSSMHNRSFSKESYSAKMDYGNQGTWFHDGAGSFTQDVQHGGINEHKGGLDTTKKITRSVRRGPRFERRHPGFCWLADDRSAAVARKRFERSGHCFQHRVL